MTAVFADCSVRPDCDVIVSEDLQHAYSAAESLRCALVCHFVHMHTCK